MFVKIKRIAKGGSRIKRVLEEAIEANLKSVFIIGIDDNDQYHFASSRSASNVAEDFWDLTKAREFIMNPDPEEEEE